MATSGQGVLRRLLVVFEFGVDTSKVDAGKRKLDSLFKDMQKVATAIAGGAIAKGIGSFVKDTVDEMMMIRKGAAELRITTDEMQALRSAGRALGMDVKWLHFSMERLQVSTELAARGSARQAASMQLLGLKTHDAGGKAKSAAELFLDVADGIAKLKDPSKQAIAVWDMFGRGGHRLLPMLRLGRERIEELMNVTKEYGKYQAETIELAGKYTFTLEVLKARLTGVKDYIMSQWLPILDKQTQKLQQGIGALLKLAKNSNLAKVSLYALQAVISLLAVKMMVAFPLATALSGALAVLVGVMDDLSVWWEGGSSLFGRALDAIFGKGESTRILEKAKEEWEGILRTMRELWNFLSEKFGIKSQADKDWEDRGIHIDRVESGDPETGDADTYRVHPTYAQQDKINQRKYYEWRAQEMKRRHPKKKGILRRIGESALEAPGAAYHDISTVIGGLADLWARFDTHNFEFGKPAMTGDGTSVSIGAIVVQSDSASPEAHGKAAAEALQRELRAAKASQRREKHQ